MLDTEKIQRTEDYIKWILLYDFSFHLACKIQINGNLVSTLIIKMKSKRQNFK